MKIKLLDYLKEKRLFLILFSFSFLIFSLWLLAFFPGNMSPDSIWQWRQASDLKNMSDWHPYIHTLIIWILRLIWDSPAIVSLFQIVLSSFLVSYFTYFLLKNGASRFWSYFAYFAFVFSVPIGIYNVTPWKDVLFTQLIFLLLIVFTRHYLQYKKTGKPLSPNFIPLFLFAFLIALISVLRHNGIFYFILVPLIYYCLKMMLSKKLIYLFAFSFGFVMFFKFILASWLNVDMSKQVLKEFPKMKIVAAVLASGSPKITSGQQEVLFNIAPREVWENYNCVNDYTLFGDPRFDQKKLLAKNEFRRNWNKVFWGVVNNNPKEALFDRACLAVNQLLGRNLFFLGISENDFGLKQSPIWFNDIFRKIIQWSKNFPQRIFFWSPGFYLLSAIIIFFYSWLKKHYLILGYQALVLANLPFIFLLAMAAEFRYLFIIYYSFFFLLPLLTLKFQNGKT